MKNAIRLTLLALLCAGLVACKKEQVKPVVEPEPEPPRQEAPPPADPNAYRGAGDHTKPEGLDDPANLLNRRVIYFDFDKSNIRPEFRDILAAHGTYLGANPGARVTLEGHADERGTREYNLGLGERRGNSVSGMLDAQGGSGSQLSVVSYGEERPTSTCSNESCWSKNRRVEIIYTRRQ